MARKGSLKDQIMDRSEKNDAGCWVWKMSKNRDGYGHFGVAGKILGAHRVSYEAFIGSIPQGMSIDHLCRNRSCVNPQHLECVTQKENVLRGESFSANASRRTSCINGHPFDDQNTLLTKGRRHCRKCNNLRTKKSYLKRLAEIRCEGGAA